METMNDQDVLSCIHKHDEQDAPDQRTELIIVLYVRKPIETAFVEVECLLKNSLPLIDDFAICPVRAGMVPYKSGNALLDEIVEQEQRQS